MMYKCLGITAYWQRMNNMKYHIGVSVVNDAHEYNM